ncbi:MAG TPA: holo-ACP synthase [Candidatus Kapabacteria bacterium]|nr:holo-ACP synthase [Candidatus Kapabacteria bacterium]
MIVGIGTDLAEVERIARALATYGEQFERRVFSDEEIAYCRSTPGRMAERYAARFAAKEAFSKALGTGMRMGVAWRDIVVRRAMGGRPMLELHGRAAQLAVGMRTHLSLTHTDATAMAVVVLEQD